MVHLTGYCKKPLGFQNIIIYIEGNCDYVIQQTQGAWHLHGTCEKAKSKQRFTAADVKAKAYGGETPPGEHRGGEQRRRLAKL